MDGITRFLPGHSFLLGVWSNLVLGSEVFALQLNFLYSSFFSTALGVICARDAYNRLGTGKKRG